MANAVSGAFSGNNYLAYDKLNEGARESRFVFEGGEFVVNEVEALHIRFQAWADSDQFFLNFGATTPDAYPVSGIFDGSKYLFWSGIGSGILSADPGLLEYVDGWTKLPAEDWVRGEWNDVLFSYIKASGELIAQINGGTEVPIRLWGNPDTVLIDRVEMRNGDSFPFFIDNLWVSVEEILPLPEITPGLVFRDGFENSPVEATPGADDPDTGAYIPSGNFITTQRGPDPVLPDSPAEAAAGNNHVGLDNREAVGNPQLALEFERIGSPPNPAFIPANAIGVEASFYIWIAANELSVATVALGSGASLQPDSQLINLAIGGAALQLSYWNGEAYVDTGLAVLDREWTKVNLIWDGIQAWASVGDGDPVEIGLFGSAEENIISRLIFATSSDSTQTVYYVDEIQVDLIGIGPGEPPALSASLAVDNIVISWDAALGEGFTLMNSDTVDGDYSDAGLAVTVAEGVASVQVTPDADSRFYQLQQQ